MNRNAIGLPWFAFLFVCLFGLTANDAFADTPARQPNVLLILVDDLKPALGCYGDTVAQTPHLDALAARGTRFELAYCNQAVCAPSRFTLMLGTHSTSTGLYNLGNQLRTVLPDAVTLPQYFAKFGYRTESLGKVFHIGHGNLGDPDSFSVPHFHEKVIEYVDPSSTDGGKLTREEAYFTNQRLGEIKSLPRGAAFESPDVDDVAYADGRVAEETILRLRAAKERRERSGTPFFIASGFARPHLPFSAPKKYWDLYDPASLPMPSFEELPADSPAVAGKRGGEITNYKPVPEEREAEYSDDLKRQLIHGYYASTSYVDAQIGKVTRELERLGLADETIVVLWGDHGFHLGDLGIWTKHTNYEQANRIPIVIAAPGVSVPGTSTRQLAESVDLFPTLAELAGLPAPQVPQPIEGLSLVPVLKDVDARVRDHAYHAYPKQKLGRAIRTDRYRLVQWKGVGEDDKTAEYELYDYELDPLETRNLADEQPGVVAQLAGILAKYPEPLAGPRRGNRTKAAAKKQSNAPERPKLASFGSHPGRWSAEKANAWYDQVLWPVGANYVPSTAINPLEMWQADTFDPETIDRELGWAAEISMNTMRVFLHDLAWKQDPQGFLRRVDEYLAIADKHGIRTMFVFFDSVWNPHPQVGEQPQPKPGVHNSGWVQSPGRDILEDSSRHAELKPYVQAVLTRYRDDPRVLVWDLINEPENPVRNSYGEAGLNTEMPPAMKRRQALELMNKAFAWAREVSPSQPLTVGVWQGDYLHQPSPIHRACIEQSDVISFHTYHGPEQTRALVEGLVQLGRPVLCTEYMARGNDSTFAGILPIFHQYRVGAYNWGFVDGKSQTIYPWDSWQQAYDSEPDPWFHDVFRRDGTPYDPAEVELIRKSAAQPPTWPGGSLRVSPAMKRSEIQAGLRSHDRALFIKEGWIRDPFITMGPDNYFYLTGTTPNEGDPREKSDPYNIGLGDTSIVGSKARVWRSKDLIDWESLGAPFTLRDGIWAQTNRRAFATTPQDQWFLWAPELHWLGDRWALVHTSPSPVKGANLSLSAGREVKGPWDNPFGAKLGRRHDPSMFQDDDGVWWLIWGATEIAPLNKDFSDFTAEPTRIGPSGDSAKMGHEGCLIMKIHGKYVLFGTGWSTGQMRRGSYNLYYATADKVTGPYSERKFAGRFLGHGTPFQDRHGRWWCTAFFNGNVPPLSRKGIEKVDLRHTAQTINGRGTTIVPMDVRLLENGELYIRAKDPAYATVGPDEAQSLSE